MGFCVNTYRRENIQENVEKTNSMASWAFNCRKLYKGQYFYEFSRCSLWVCFCYFQLVSILRNAYHFQKCESEE